MRPASVLLPFLGVILVWSTTPLAIKWSGEGPGPFFGAAIRMAIGALGALLLLRLLGRSLPWHRRALHTYLAAALSLFGNMVCVYWGAQYIPSGVLAVVFGLMPVATALIAAVVLDERSLTPLRIVGMILGVSGLVLIFAHQLAVGGRGWLGVAAVFAGMLFHSGSTVWVKRVGRGLDGSSVATGGLLMSLPFYGLTWLAIGMPAPGPLTGQALASIVYLALFGSVLAFMWYFHALRHVEASRMALIPLVTPVAAMLLGILFNDEAFSGRTLAGSVLILLALLVYQWPALHRWHRGRRANP